MSSADKPQAPVSARASVLVVDDHPIVRRGLRELIGQEPDLVVSAEAEDGAAALDAVGAAVPDLCIVDLSLRGMNGLELIKHLHARYPDLPILVLSMLDEALYAERALRAGARGYIMKHEAAERVITAIRRVLRGDIYLSEARASQLLEQMVAGRATPPGGPLRQLSDRELEVFRLIGLGRGTRQISQELTLSVKTIESYRENIKHKLGLRNATELVQHAMQWVMSEDSQL